MLIPEEHGGLDADPVMYAIFCEAMAMYSLDFAACVMTSMLTATNIAHHGTQQQKQTYLPGFLTGDTKFSVSISEPGVGSDAAAVATKAVLDGDHWVLNGNKTWCSGAQLPGTVITILARNGPDRHRGMSLILVPNTTEDVDIRKLNTIVRRSLGTTEIFLTDAKVPAGRRQHHRRAR